MLKNCLVLVCLITFLNSMAFAQNSTTSYKKNNITVGELLKDLGKAINYSFMYSNTDINESQKISFEVQNQNVKQVLDKLSGLLNVSYQLDGNHVILKKNSTNRLITVTGIVKDSAGEPLIGASVQQINSTNGTITEMDGTFTLTVPSNSTLSISYLGYVTQNIQVKNKKQFEITLLDNSEMLEEVVVIGYATQKKENLTGAVESVDLSKAKGRAYTNASAMLQGNISGAFITQKSGQPGNDDATINIRGIGTFGNSDPLVIVDGMEASLGSINPKDIESVSVLKDAASCAIYGNRASNGVILIKTKTGENDKMNIEYNGLYGIQKATSLPSVLKGLDFLELKAEAYRNTNGNDPNWYTDEYMNNYRNHVDEYMYPTNYSWLDETYRFASMTDHYLSMTGGGKNLKYATSVGYLYQDGIIKGNSSNRFTFRSNVSASFLNNKLKVNAGISTQYKTIDDLVDGASSAIYSSYVAPPTISMKIPGLGYSNHGFTFGARDAGGFNKTTEIPLTLNGSIELTPLKGLGITVYGGMDRGDWKKKRFVPSVQLFALQDDGSVVTPKPRTSELNQDINNWQTWVFNALTNYTINIAKKHDLGLMGGYEMRKHTTNNQSMFVRDLTVNLPEFEVGDPNTMKINSGASELAWLSYFGRFNYAFNSRYLLEFNLRYDGSSRFIEKWGLFPSVSAGWRISEEKFMEELNWLNNLKIRFSWGKLGNESIGQAYAASDELSLDGKYNFNNTLVSAAYVSKLANRLTSWETSEQYNIGVDFDIFSKISGTLEYYIKNASDILMQVPVSSTLGMSTDPYQNSGKMTNKGLEMLLRYNDRFGELGFNTNVSASYIRNEVKNLAGVDELIRGNTIWRIGSSFNSLYGLETEGIYQSDEEIKNHLVFSKNGISLNPYYGMTPVPGDIRFKDQITEDTDGDGIPDARDGIINEKDRVILGQTFPKWTFSGTIGFDWKGFDISMFLQGVAGIKALNQGIITVPFHGGEANTGAWYEKRWTPENPSKKIQRIFSDPKRSELVSEYYLEDASYIRCKSLDFGYTVPKRLVRKLFATDSSIRVYLSFQNLFTITNMRYKFDPEKPTTVTNTLQYPQSKIYSLGVNLKF